MSWTVCTDCITLGVCQNRVSNVVSSEELSGGLFRLDACSEIAVELKTKKIPYRRAIDYMIEKYRDFNGMIVGAQGEEVFVDIKPLIDAPEQWWRDVFYKPRVNAIALNVNNKPRLITLLSIQRAASPATARFWGLQERAANDNEPS